MRQVVILLVTAPRDAARPKIALAADHGRLYNAWVSRRRRRARFAVGSEWWTPQSPRRKYAMGKVCVVTEGL
jgi:hypothetical protein